MDGMRRRPSMMADGVRVNVPVLVRVQDVIDAQQPAVHLSCDWLGDPLALGLHRFSVEIYAKMEAYQNGSSS